VIDFHCHLDLYPDPAAVVAGCRQRGTYVLAVTTTPRAWNGNVKLIGDSARIRLAPGLHPEIVPERHSELPLLLPLIRRSRYVGEVGIDGGLNLRPHAKLQRDVFLSVLAECSAQGGRVISIHSRGAATIVLDALAAHRDAGIPVLHWFSGSRLELDRAVSLGCWFSVGPGMLRSKKGAQLAQSMPHDRVLTETDAPFVQHEGRPLMPWETELAESVLADCWRLPVVKVREQILLNLQKLSEASQSFSVIT
jgi:TatD DNase family protein